MTAPAPPTAIESAPSDRPTCAWAISTPDYLAYHDQEWGTELHGDDQLFERMTLEAFQSGLSWLTILRKRDNFRAAFAGFRIDEVACFTGVDHDRLMNDSGIVRNRAKISAAINNARVAADLAGGLDALLWSFAPVPARPAPANLQGVPAKTAESAAMAKDLKKRGFAFVGPITAYALMQATGMVFDHVADCWRTRERYSATTDVTLPCTRPAAQ